MAKGKLHFRRRRESKTDYKRRLAQVKSGKTMLVFRKTNKHCILQLNSYNENGDKSQVHVTTKNLAKYGWTGKSNIPSAYLCGYLAGKKALKKGINEAILNIGNIWPIKKSTPFAALKGAIDAGLNIPHSTEVLPDEKHINGKHIEEYAKVTEEKARFSDYIEKGLDPKKLSETFSETKKKIDQEFSG